MSPAFAHPTQQRTRSAGQKVLCCRGGRYSSRNSQVGGAAPSSPILTIKGTYSTAYCIDLDWEARPGLEGAGAKQMAVSHLQAHGLEEGDATRLAAAFSKMGIDDAPAVEAHLSKFTAAKTPLSLEDWYSCFSRCPELLSTSPQVLSERLTKLKELMSVDEEQLVSAVTKAPSLLQHAPADIADKVEALQGVMSLPEEQASAQLIIERFSRYPAILARNTEALEAQLSGLAGLLGCDLQRASRLAFKVPALAAASNEELEEHMNTLAQLLELEQTVVRGLVLRQPSLLARASDGLQSKVTAYADIFGEDVGQALAAAPQLLTMKTDAVKSRYNVLCELAALQPGWSEQLDNATSETLAVWLCSSEKKLRRLELATTSPKLARLQLYRLLSNSESRWVAELASAGLAPDGQPREGSTGSTGAPASAGGDEGAPSSKPKRPRGGRREREKRERAAARAAAAAAGGGSDAAGPAASSSSNANEAAGGEGGAAAAASGKPKRPRGGRRERERRERIARRQAEEAGAADGVATPAGQPAVGFNGAAGSGGHGGSDADGAQQTGSGNVQGGGAAGAADRPRRTRGGRREREKRERREARTAAAAGCANGGEAAGDGADGDSSPGQDFGEGFGPQASGDNGAASDGDSVEGDGEGGTRPKRATRGGRREREKRERLAARLAAATATAAATAALDAF